MTPLIPSKLLVSIATLLFTLDLIGTFVFALSGAASGIKNKLDAFGIGVLAFVAGNAGGVMRDLLIGAVPPAAIDDWHYVAVSLVAAAVTFAWYPNVKRLQPIVLLFDAAGLGLFAVSGTQKALAFGIHPMEAALLGMLTGIGGGVLRDLLVNEIPVVLHADLYAVAALAGAAVVVAGHVGHWPPIASTIGGATLCFVMRLIAIRRGWSLPARLPRSS
jgi:uncharacterized membrane protein YeiH